MRQSSRALPAALLLSGFVSVAAGAQSTFSLEFQGPTATVGLPEPAPPGVGVRSDPGDNLDALDLDTAPPPPPTPVPALGPWGIVALVAALASGPVLGLGSRRRRR